MTGDPREARKRAFLSAAGWGDADRAHLSGDASARRYERLHLAGRTAVLMDSPPGPGDDTADFLRIAGHLSGLGLSPPRILDAWPDDGLVLLEDLGDALFTNVLAAEPALEGALYQAAVEVLLAVQAAAPPAGVPDLTPTDWAVAAAMATDWYAAAITGQRPDPGPFTRALAAALERHADGPRNLILRDYHAGNLIWLPDRKGAARVGLLDFQQAQMGQPVYDLISLVQDARRDVGAGTQAACRAQFAASAGLPIEALDTASAVIAAQRALRILGIFARLCLVAAKPAYVALIPRVWAQLTEALRHPDLAELRAVCRALLPEPTPQALDRITLQCGRNPFR